LERIVISWCTAQYGHKEILEFCVAHGCPWHESAFRNTLRHKNIECLKYIFEKCKDIQPWVEFIEMNYMCSKESKQYLYSVKEEWQWYTNRDKNIKG
jgi:hypothetical protein